MKTKWRRVLYSIGMGLGICLFILQLWNGFRAIAHNALSSVNLDAALISWALVASAIGLQMLTWKYIMSRLHAPLRWRRVVEGYPISFLPRYIPGSVWGYMTRGQWFFDHCNVPFAHTSAGSIIEIAVSVLAVLLIIGWKYVYGLDIFFQLVILGTTIVLFWGMQIGKRWVVNNITMSRHFTPVVKTVRILVSIKASTLLIGIALFIIIWVLYGGLTLEVMRLFGLSQTIDLYTATFIFSTAWLVGFLIVFIPAGIGIREVIFSSLLVSYAGVSSQQGSAIAVMSRLIILIGEATWVVAGLVLSRLAKSNQNDPRKADSPN
jgi:glycosyltransferase 2 family protein